MYLSPAGTEVSLGGCLDASGDTRGIALVFGISGAVPGALSLARSRSTTDLSSCSAAYMGKSV